MEIKIFDHGQNYKNIITKIDRWELLFESHLKNQTNLDSPLELQFILRNLSCIFFPDELCDVVMYNLITLIAIDRMDNILYNIKDNFSVVEWIELWARNIIEDKSEVEKSISKCLMLSFNSSFIRYLFQTPKNDLYFEIKKIISNDGIYNITRSCDIFFAIGFETPDNRLYKPFTDLPFGWFLQIGGYEFPYFFDEKNSLNIEGITYYYNDTLRIVPTCLLKYQEIKVIFKKESLDIDDDFYPCLKTLNCYIIDQTTRRKCLEKYALLNMIYKDRGIYRCLSGVLQKY